MFIEDKENNLFHIYGLAGFKNVGNTLEYKNGKRILCIKYDSTTLLTEMGCL